MAFLRGRRGVIDDILEGTTTADYIFGRGGNDLLRGLAGDDYIRGDDGNDTVEGGDGNDRLFGKDGDDQIIGGDGNDLLDGGNGEDGLDGGDGNDTLLGGSNSSIRTTREIIIRDPETLELIFSATVPTIEFIGGDTLVGGAGDDLITANAGDDIVDGGADNDTIVGGTGKDLIFGGTGEDEISGGADDDTLIGESGNDTLLASSGADLIIGDQDALGGPDGDDEINAGADDDIVFGGGGSDTIIGGDGDDLIDGGDSRSNALLQRDVNGNDELLGGVGNDTIRGGLGRDTLDGGGTRAGEIDFLTGTAFLTAPGDPTEVLGAVSADGDSDLFILGNEEVFLYSAGAGDVIGTNIFGQGDRAIIQLFENGVDKIQVNDPTAIITNTLGTTSTFILIPIANGFEIIAELQNFTDALAPSTFIAPPIDNSGDDIFQGTEGNDFLDGGEGNDQLTGLGGDDTLDGGTGIDILDGSDGIDTASYENDPAAVQVNLVNQTATDGFGNTDTLLNIENIVGSAFADLIVGDAQANNLNGGAGDDTLEGGAGDDTLEGGAGQDILTGATGVGIGELDQLVSEADGEVDRFVLGDSNSAFYIGGGATLGLADRAVIIGFENGLDEIQVNASGGVFVNSLGSATDSFILTQANGNFEIIAQIVGVTAAELDTSTFVAPPFDNSGDDIFQGTASNDFLDGGEGNDELTGLGGDDTLDGGAGNDMLFGGAGNDSLIGGTGADTLTGATQAGIGELDQLVSGADGEVDRFVLGDSSSAFYIGGGATLGLADRAVIIGFENGLDEIQVNVSGGVFVNSLGSATDSFILTQANGNFEIIAQIVGVTAAELDTSTFVAA